MIDNRLVITEDLVVILPAWAWLLPFVILYCMYLVRQAWANSVDPDETHKCGVSSGSTLFATHSAILDTTLGSKFYLFKFFDKYGKELRYLNTKGKYGKVTDTKIKWLIVSKSVTIIIFVEFVDQLIDYLINCASLNYHDASIYQCIVTPLLITDELGFIEQLVVQWLQIQGWQDWIPARPYNLWRLIMK